MSDFYSLTNVVRCLGALAFVGLCFLVTGFSSEYWQDGEQYNNLTKSTSRMYNGLWKDCRYSEEDGSQCHEGGDDIGGWLNYVKSIEGAGIGVALATLLFWLLAIYFEYRSQKNYASWTILASSVLSLMTGIIILIGVIIYASAHTLTLGWAFGMCTTAGVVFLCDGILPFIYMRIKKIGNFE